MVAKSFQNFEILTDVYEVSGKKYVRVRNPKTGTERQVRWYTEKEYARMYPEDAKSADSGSGDSLTGFNAKKALGFEKGYISLFKGDTYPYQEWFSKSIARYHDTWGWYIVSTDEVPADLPPSVSIVQLKWEDISDGEKLKPQPAIKQAVEALLYDDCPSEFQASIGSRIERELTIKKAIKSDGYYGTSYFYVMEDENKNIYVWATSARNWQEGEVHKLRGTVKEHKLYKNQKQTVLTRCTEIK